LQKRYYLDIIEGPHLKEEDSNNKTAEPWAVIDEDQSMRELPHGYHKILHVFKRTISKKRKI